MQGYKKIDMSCICRVHVVYCFFVFNLMNNLCFCKIFWEHTYTQAEIFDIFHCIPYLIETVHSLTE